MSPVAAMAFRAMMVRALLGLLVLALLILLGVIAGNALGMSNDRVTALAP